MHKAAAYKRRTICCMLVAAGASLLLKDGAALSPRQLALMAEDLELAEYLKSQEHFQVISWIERNRKLRCSFRMLFKYKYAILWHQYCDEFYNLTFNTSLTVLYHIPFNFYSYLNTKKRFFNDYIIGRKSCRWRSIVMRGFRNTCMSYGLVIPQNYNFVRYVCDQNY